MPTLAPPPRRIPARLWLRLAFGNGIAQIGWSVVAVLVIGARLIEWKNAPLPADDIPIAWMGVIALVAASPALGIAGWRSHRQLHLLRHGIETRGTLLDKREVHVAEGSVWHYQFEFRDARGERHIATTRTEYRQPVLEDDALETMVYDPKRPERAMPLDHLPGSPALSETGALVARDPHVFWWLVAPTVALAALIQLHVV